MRVLKAEQAVRMGFRADRRRRKRQHRQAARSLLGGGTLMNARAPSGSVPHAVAQWHLRQALYL